MMLHPHFLALGLSTLLSEVTVLDAVAPTSTCCVCVTENRGRGVVPDR